ncbi:hypothetical protein ACFLZV_03910 [Candidatus Margulisiibacteriota bacterium]
MNFNRLKCFLGIIFFILIINGASFGQQNKMKTFKIKNIIKKSWGKLVSVYEQPTSQRLTFDSDAQVTIIEVGLTWNAITKKYHPDIKQVIEIRKSEEENSL